jgi:hypothetical protein
MGYCSGTLHIIKLADIFDAVTAADAAANTEAAAAAAALAAAGSEDDPGGPTVAQALQPAAAAAAAPRTAALPAGCVWSVDCQDRLVSCAWAAGELPELATAGPQGVKVRRFVEVRQQLAHASGSAGSSSSLQGRRSNEPSLPAAGSAAATCAV